MRYTYYKDKKIAYGNERIKAVIPETNEKIEVDVRDEKRYGVLPFYKTFERAYAVYFTLTAKNASIFVYFLKTMDKTENMVIATYNEISKGANVSLKTVERAMIDFQACDFVRSPRRGIWIVNPYMFLKGDISRQAKIGRKFFAIDKKAKIGHTVK